MRPEYDELKEEITRLGGTRKIRDMLTANEGQQTDKPLLRTNVFLPPQLVVCSLIHYLKECGSMF